jgi:hypothetical protein
VRIVLASGQIFDLAHANVFSLPIGFYNEHFSAKSLVANTLLFSFPDEALADFALRSPPIIPQVWRNMIAFAVTDVAHRQTPEPSGHEGYDLMHRNPDFLSPLPPKKEPGLTRAVRRIREFLWWIVSSMDPRPPQGLRHFAVPKHYVVNKDATIKRDV